MDHVELCGIRTRVPRMVAILDTIRAYARLDACVLIEGETGTGKELAARALHALSDRAHRPIVTADCAALPESLAESELFGHERGSFTGAERSYCGRIESAAGGTLFLDEVNSLPLALQGKLLRFLELREFTRIGHARPTMADVRVVSATNQPLDQLVARGGMRADFYYRLHVLGLKLLPLRERREDIPLLVEQFLREDALARGVGVRSVSDAVLAQCMAMPWPGNVRELHNVLRRSVALGSEDGVLRRLAAPVVGHATPAAPPPEPLRGDPAPAAPSCGSFRRWMREQERAYLQRLVDGRLSITEQTAVSGLPQRTLYRKLRAHGLRAVPRPAGLAPLLGAAAGRPGGAVTPAG